MTFIINLIMISDDFNTVYLKKEEIKNNNKNISEIEDG